MLTIEVNEVSVAFVVGLLTLECPSAVRRRVVTVVVDAVDGMLGRGRLSHIRQEIFKFQPSRAYLYTPSAVVPVIRVSGVYAASDHILPSSVGFGFGHTVAQGWFNLRQKFVSVAAAGRSLPTAEQFSQNNSLLPTITDAEELRAATRCVLREPKNKQASKSLAGLVLDLSLACKFSPMATARAGVAVSQMSSMHDPLRTAITLAKESSLTVSRIVRALEYKQATESLASFVLKCRRSHVMTCQQEQSIRLGWLLVGRCAVSE